MSDMGTDEQPVELVKLTFTIKRGSALTVGELEYTAMPHQREPYVSVWLHGNTSEDELMFRLRDIIRQIPTLRGRV